MGSVIIAMVTDTNRMHYNAMLHKSSYYIVIVIVNYKFISVTLKLSAYSLALCCVKGLFRDIRVRLTEGPERGGREIDIIII